METTTAADITATEEQVINTLVEGIEQQAKDLQSRLEAEVPANEEDDQLLVTKPNFIGAVIGVGAAVALEIASPTGNKKSALAAAAVGGAVLYATRAALGHKFQNKLTASICGLVAFKCAKGAGRNVAEYFPNTHLAQVSGLELLAEGDAVL